MVKIKKLLWDNWNIRHIKKHRVVTSEVEEACKLSKKSLKTYKGRLIVLARTKKGRLLTVVLGAKGKGKYYVVTARDMSKKERRFLK